MGDNATHGAGGPDGGGPGAETLRGGGGTSMPGLSPGTRVPAFQRYYP